MCWVFVDTPELSLDAESGGYSLAAVHGLLVAVASHYRAWSLGHTGSVVVVHGLVAPTAHGIFPDQGSNMCPLALVGGFLTTGPPGKSGGARHSLAVQWLFRTLWFHLPGTQVQSLVEELRSCLTCSKAKKN